MPIAAIDIGTNSVLLLIADKRDKELLSICDLATVTRLGQNVDKTGQLAPEAIERTLACLSGYAEKLAEAGVVELDVVATSAMRDAAGGEAFLEKAEKLLAVRPRVISGEEEAELTFSGALIGLEPSARVAVFDVGGGSTEIVVGTRDQRGSLEHAVSLDIGSVRLTERHLHSDPPTAREVDAVRSTIRQALAGAPSLKGLPLVGVAGTVTTLAAVVHEIAPYDGSKVHGATLSQESIDTLIVRLAACSIEERKQIAGLSPKRADVIVAGALIVDEICRAADAPRITVSDRGVRWGLAQKLANAD